MSEPRPLLRRWAVRLRAPDREPETIYVFSASAVTARASAVEKLCRRLTVETDYRRRPKIDVLEVVEAP